MSANPTRVDFRSTDLAPVMIVFDFSLKKLLTVFIGGVETVENQYLRSSDGRRRPAHPVDDLGITGLVVHRQRYPHTSSTPRPPVVHGLSPWFPPALGTTNQT